MKRTLHASAIVVTMIAVALVPSAPAFDATWCPSDAAKTNTNLVAEPAFADRLLQVENKPIADLEVTLGGDGPGVDANCDGKNGDGGGGGGLPSVGTLWSSSTVTTFTNVDETCGSESHWKITAEVVAGDADGGAHAFLKCGDAENAEKVSCDILSGKKTCNNELTEIAAGAEGGLNCDADLNAGSEDANVDVECVDPPLPGKAGKLIKRLLAYDAVTETTETLSYTIEILPAL